MLCETNVLSSDERTRDYDEQRQLIFIALKLVLRIAKRASTQCTDCVAQVRSQAQLEVVFSRVGKAPSGIVSLSFYFSVVCVFS